MKTPMSSDPKLTKDEECELVDITKYRGMIGIKVSYGTAGFRADASILKSTKLGDDYGVKIADPSGGMLSQLWEPFADHIANAQDAQTFLKLITEFAKKENIPLDGAKQAVVLLGRDTRPSGESLVEAAKQMCGNLQNLIPKKGGDNHPIGKLIVDCSNGVGGEKLQVLKEKLNWLDVEIRNSGKEGVLNEGVGADFVQKEKVVPQGFGPPDVGVRLSAGELSILIDDKDEYQPRVGVIQTAYANGASTKYLNQLGLEVIFAPTGVKYLHAKAEEYDIGIYFEANGHGTILFSDHFLNWLEGRKSTEKGLEKQNAAKRLWAVTKLINQAVGDALSGLVLVEAILQHMGWPVDKWNELYHDLPSRQLKVRFSAPYFFP
ncbi:phosphoacetylglucosamine mutase [Tanacetum coccineum]